MTITKTGKQWLELQFGSIIRFIQYTHSIVTGEVIIMDLNSGASVKIVNVS